MKVTKLESSINEQLGVTLKEDASTLTQGRPNGRIREGLFGYFNR